MTDHENILPEAGLLDQSKSDAQKIEATNEFF